MHPGSSLVDEGQKAPAQAALVGARLVVPGEHRFRAPDAYRLRDVDEGREERRVASREFTSR
jgi:hypothetical protein